jgi:hypothetical protein
MIPGEKYDVRVLSSTKAGWPDTNLEQTWVPIEMPQANDTVPQAPDVEIREVNATAIKARWSVSKKNKIQPSAFKVSLMENEKLIRGPIKVDGSVSTYIFDNLGNAHVSLEWLFDSKYLLL